MANKVINIFSYIRDNVDILEVISEYVTLKQYGNYWKGLSPFKSEKTPSFTVTPEKKIYYCFSTNNGGDIISFVSKIENCNQFEAALLISKKYNLGIENTLLKKNKDSFSEKEMHIRICEFFMNWCKKKLQENKEALDYLKKRKILESSIKRFSIGYCPTSRLSIKDFISNAQKNNILLSDLIIHKIINENKEEKNTNNKYYFLYEDRIIFPITNIIGICIGFSGRTFKEKDERVKYINSSSSSEFSKKTLLYGLHLAKKSIQKEKNVYLVEGYFDVIGTYQDGFENTVATMGTACTEEHISILSKLSNQITLIYDGDEAGQNAILKITKYCWKESLEAYIVCLPKNEDPHSLSIKNELHFFIKNKIDSINFFISKKTENFSTLKLKEKMILISDFLNIISNIEDPIKKEILISEISNKFSISNSFLKNEINLLKNSQKNKNIETNNFLIKNEENKIEEKTEKLLFIFLLSCIVFYKKNFDLIEKHSDIFFSKKIPHFYFEIWEKFIFFKKNQNNDYDYLLFFDTLNKEIKNKFILEMSIQKLSVSYISLFYKTLKQKFFL